MKKLLEKNKWLAIILIILVTIEIFWFSSIPGSSAAGGGNWPARIYHFSVFFLFTFFLLAAIKGNKKIKLSFLIFVLIIAITQSFLDEVHQIFVPLRDASMRDIMTNTLGIFTAIILYAYTERNQ